MTDRVVAGEYEVVSLVDGQAFLPPSFYPGAEHAEFADLIDASGTYPIHIGAFLVRGPNGVTLIDAGAGAMTIPFPAELAEANSLANPPANMLESGVLPQSMAAAGVDPSDVTSVLLTHLHPDHHGWIVADGKPFFPNAVVYYGASDWDALIESADEDDPSRRDLELARDAGILRAFAEDGGEVVPGIRTVHTPGHTPGSYILVLKSGADEVYFVGDLLEHPGQLTDGNIHFATDMDREATGRSRVTVFAEAKQKNAVIAASHVTNPIFRRISADDAWLDATQG